MRASRAVDCMGDTVQRGVQVVVYTDLELNKGVDRINPEGNPGKIAQFEAAVAALRAKDIEVRIVNKVHSKIVMADQELLCIGSFNWLSAQRQGDYVRHETSMVYRGPDVSGELEVNRSSLETRVVKMERYRAPANKPPKGPRYG